MLCPTPRQTWLTQGQLEVADLARDVTYQLAPEAPWAADLRSEQRPEAYRLEITAEGATAIALTPEGLLRAQATLRQLWRDGRLPVGVITDWPEFRYRCASDWLINVECNRWSYDWGDGPEATLARMAAYMAIDTATGSVPIAGDVVDFPGAMGPPNTRLTLYINRSYYSRAVPGGAGCFFWHTYYPLLTNILLFESHLKCVQPEQPFIFKTR